MSRIFLTIAVMSEVFLGYCFWFGWEIGDGQMPDPEIQARVGTHFLVGVVALLFAILVHAIVLTYFMGTGRWMEDTCRAYGLGENPVDRVKSLKYRTIPVLVLCVSGLIGIAGFGAATDLASPSQFAGWFSLTPVQLHFWTSLIVLVGNGLGLGIEYCALVGNAGIIREVMDRVTEIRSERGLG